MSAITSAERCDSSSAISPKAMPAVSVASRTPSGRVTCTAPLRSKNSEGAGAPAETTFSPASLHAGEDHRDVVRSEFVEFLGDQPRARPCQRGDAVQVEDDELRARPRGQLARDVVDVGKGQRANELDDADLLVMAGQNVALARPAAAPRRILADRVVGDDAGPRIVAAVE